MKKKNQSGQIIIILLLLMLVALSVGLALTQRSVNDVSTSTQSEQSSRAFSAAEAGLEKALSGSYFQTGGTGNTPLQLGNDSSAKIDQSNFLPLSGSSAAIEYPPIGRETTAQFWFVDPALPPPPVDSFYHTSSVNLYYGNEGTSDLPAVEVAVITQKGGNYYNKNYYFDSNTSRAGTNKFTPTSTAGTCGGNPNPTLSTSILGAGHKFYCRQTFDIKDGSISSSPPSCTTANNCKIILARVRFLYINENHNLALEPASGSTFPPQVQIYNSVGISGQSQKQVQAFKVKDVVPPWFDYAVFSVNEIRK